MGTDEDLEALRIDRGSAAGLIRREPVAPAAVPRPAPTGERTRPQRRIRRVALALVAALLGAGGLAAWLARPPEVAVDTVAAAFPSQQALALTASGYVVAQRQAAVASKATGRVDWIGVVEGSRVRAGDEIARLDARDVQAQRASARAAVGAAEAAIAEAAAEARDARAAAGRASSLRGRGFLSEQAELTALARAERADAAVLAAQARFEVARADARAARVAVEFTRILAPFDGVVLRKVANVGDVVTPLSAAAESKGAVVTMADLATLEVEVDVAEGRLASVRLEQPCEILLDALPGERMRGTVSAIVPSVDRAKATVPVKVRFERIDPRVLPDMSAKVNFLSRPVDDADLRAVPSVAADAVVERDGRALVWRVEGERVRAVPVEAGARLGERVALKGGVPPLALGDRVVVRPPASLGDGDRVTAGTAAAAARP